MDLFHSVGWQLTLDGYIVLTVGVCKHAPNTSEKKIFTIPVDNIPANQISQYLTEIAGQFVDTGHGGEALGPEIAAKLDELHFRKIDLADWILILNYDGYIGESTRKEIEYARSIGKIIRYLESESVYA
jgi:hypothetical protein